MVGEGSVERRRFLQLTSRSEANGQVSAYSRAVAAMVRATSLDRSVRDAVDEGRRAVEMAREGADDVVVAALAALAQALYFAGDLGGAWAAGLEAIEHPDAERRTPGQSLARSSLALVAVERGNLASARLHLEAARSLLSRVGSTRNLLAALASAALGTVLYAEGNFAGAERELASAEKFFQDDVATVHQAWLLALLARARCARGRLEKADAALHACFERMAELTDAGMLTTLARAVEQELGEAKQRTSNGAVLEPPSRAELAVLRLLASDLSTREVAAELYLSPNTVRSHTRAIYRKFGVNSRSDAVARALAMGVLEQA
jgi:LuxR family maltose regulon positive regulatory protein